ncbi:eosinophil peroxidase [Salvelinus fontinalis]|uniref:eosinophil peroxidase n=1 Tax=Salvelinus fontinalis TaxID=8038 RepID=UPI0024866E4B|nr:eosinophil peroxidase [Salvelinus fontinalis]
MDMPPVGLLIVLSLALLCCLPHPASPTKLAHNDSGVPYLRSTLVEEALKRALERTNAAYAHTKERVKTSLSEGALRPSDLLAQFKQIGPQTRRHISAAELLDNTVELIREMVYTSTMAQSSLSDLLSEEDMQVLLQATGCSSEMQRPLCKTGCLSERYRSFTGNCNNRQHPKWGAANTPYSRWLPPEYEDVRGVPRGWDPEHTYYNYTLPPVRLVSQDVLYTHNENISLDSSLSHLLVEWGQWIDHDFALTPQSPSTAAFRTGADCTRTCSRDTPCFPIQIPLSDPRTGIQSCLPSFPSPQIPLSDPRTGIQSCLPSFPSPQIPLSDPRTGIQSCLPSFPSPQIPLSDPRTGIQSCLPSFPSPQIPLSDPRTGIQSCLPSFPSLQIPLSDPRTGIQSCMPFFRSAPSCVGSEAFTGATPHHHREQLNAITSFVDASMVYGSSSPMAAALRNLSSPLGLLALNDQASDQGLAYMPYLPRLQGRLDPCGPRSGSGANFTGATSASDTSATAPTEQENITSCFQAGDSRANEHLGMIALHTLFLREHNRLVRELHLLNPHWSPDTLYQEARKIMGAVHQILTWEHYLPRVLGETPTSLLMPPYKGYDPEIDPSIANVFSAAAFRFAHVTVQPMVARLGPGYSLAPQHPPLPLHHSLFASWRVVQEGGIDPVLRGLLLSPAKLQMPGQMMVEELTERLFQAQGGMPLDLGALNLQRGRDHGLPGYSSWRGLCGLSVPNTTSDLAGILGNSGLAEKFLLLYGTSQNIDVWVGAISEPPLPGGRVGPLLACLLAKQFRALRDGDRFWWEREAVFTSTQRAQLHTVSLSRIICDNTHITRVPSDPFSRTVSPEDMLACSHPLIPHLNLSAWKEPDTDPSCGPIPRLQSGFSLLCDSVIYYQCGPGYQLIGPSSVTCDPNSYQWSPAPPTCHDVDECADQPTPCPQNMDCLNTPGSYMCTDLDLSSLSAVSVVSAVIAVVGGVAIMFVILACCRRYFPKKPEPIIRTDKQNR